METPAPRHLPNSPGMPRVSSCANTESEWTLRSRPGHGSLRETRGDWVLMVAFPGEAVVRAVP